MLSWTQSGLDLSQAAATFGYAFYVQPYAVPMLRTLPPTAEGAATLVAALHVTFGLTFAAYLAVGVGGLYVFGYDGKVPQDLLQGFAGPLGGILAGIFCAYLMLCFYPSVVSVIS